MWSLIIPNFTRLFTLVHYTSPAAELGFWRPGRVIAMAVPNRNYELLKNVHFVAVCCPLDSAIPDGRTTHSSPPATPLLIPIKLDENEIFASPLGVLHFTKVIIRENVFILTHLLHAAESFAKLTRSQLIKKFPAFYGTRRLITAITRTCHQNPVCTYPLHPVGLSVAIHNPKKLHETSYFHRVVIIGCR